MKQFLQQESFSRRQILMGTSVLAASLPLVGVAAQTPIYDVTDFGASGEGKKTVTTEIQAAVNACAKAGGGVVYIPPGEYVSGAIALRTNVTLHLASGAVLRSSANRDDFGEMGALIFARGEKNIAVTGNGILHGNHEAYVRRDENGRLRGGPTGMGAHDPEPSRGSATDGRPRTVFFIECERVRLQDVLFKNGATWTVHMMGCRNVRIEGVTIDNHLEVPNNDGMDIDHCQQVRIANCNISAGDDAICLKTTNRATGLGPCEDILVTNCNLVSRSSAIKLGSAGHEPIRDALFTNCTISNSNRGVAIQNRDGGTWENIMFSHMTIETRHMESHRWGASEPIHVSNLQRSKKQSGLGKVRGVYFTDLVCHSEAGAYFYADPLGSIEDVVMNNVHLNIVPPRSDRFGFEDLRPSYIHRKPSPIEIAGVNAAGVNGLVMHGVNVRFAEAIGKGYGPALKVVDSRNVNRTGFSGKSAHPGVIPDQVVE